MHSSSSCSNNKCNAKGDDNASAVASFANSLNSKMVKQACEKAGIPTNAGFSVMGDSISTLGGYIPHGWRCHYEGEVSIPGVKHMQDTWWGQVIEHFGGHLVGNASFSGSTVEGFGFPAGCSPKRAAVLVGKSAGENPQVVLVFMGINDYGWGGATNQVMGGSASRTAEPEALGGQVPVAFTVTTDALQRFKQAYATMLGNIHAVAPEAQLWCLTLSPAVMEGFCSVNENDCVGNSESVSAETSSTSKDAESALSASAASVGTASASAANTGTASAGTAIADTASTAKPAPFIYSVRGIDLDEYNSAIRACVAEAGDYAHVADIRGFNIDYESVDNTHPTALGMKQISTMVCACMESAQVEFTGYPELACAPESQRHCDKRTCEGCTYSPLTSSSWCLVCGKH